MTFIFSYLRYSFGPSSSNEDIQEFLQILSFNILLILTPYDIILMKMLSVSEQNYFKNLRIFSIIIRASLYRNIVSPCIAHTTGAVKTPPPRKAWFFPLLFFSGNHQWWSSMIFGRGVVPRNAILQLIHPWLFTRTWELEDLKTLRKYYTELSCTLKWFTDDPSCPVHLRNLY